MTSSDSTAEVAHQAGARVITQSENWASRSRARPGATPPAGRILAGVDADSVPHERWVETVVEILDAHPEAVAVTGEGRLVDDDGEEHDGFGSVYFDWYFALVRLALAHEALFGSAMAMRRWAWERITDEVCRHDARVHDDMDLSMHLAPASHRSSGCAPHPRRVGAAWRFGHVHGDAGLARVVHAGVHYPRELPPIRWLRADRVHGRRLFAVPPLSRFSKLARQPPRESVANRGPVVDVIA